MKSTIKNVVFDIGNVLVKWSPREIVEKSFGAIDNLDEVTKQIFKHDVWTQLNTGRLTEGQAIKLYVKELDHDQPQMETVFKHIKHSQDLIAGTCDILKSLHKQGYQLFALTDNVREIVEYLQKKYDFWQYFDGVVVSAHIGTMKPGSEIFKYLLNTYHLNPNETLFIDDHLPNVESAQSLSFYGLQFFNAKQCVTDMNQLGITV